MSDILAHIFDYLEKKNHVILYINIVIQTTKIFDLNIAFALKLINVIQKNKSFKKQL